MAMFCVSVSAQVGIGTDVPKATLDVTAVNIDTIGFYYYNGTAWVKLADTAYILSSSYRNAQASNAPPRAENKEGDDVIGSTFKARIDLVKVDIY